MQGGFSTTQLHSLSFLVLGSHVDYFNGWTKKSTSVITECSIWECGSGFLSRSRFRNLGFNATFKMSLCQAVFDNGYITDSSIGYPAMQARDFRVLWISVFLTVHGLASGEVRRHCCPAVILLECPAPLGQLPGSSTNRSTTVAYIISLITYKAYTETTEPLLSQHPQRTLLMESKPLKQNWWGKQGRPGCSYLLCLSESSLQDNGKQCSVGLWCVRCFEVDVKAFSGAESFP